MSESKQQVRALLKIAHIKVNGKNPQDIRVLDERFYDRVLAHASLGLGESYMDGWWEANDLEEFIAQLMRSKVNHKVRPTFDLTRAYLAAHLRNPQSIRRAYRNAQSHYDIGNDLYIPMLGQTMAYSCAYWKGVKTLNEAQEAKLELICQKLGLKRGMRVLDIGCGWGSLVLYMARNYKVEVVGITPAREQAAYVREQAKRLKVKVVEQDYREFSTKRKFDRVVSVGMAEHIGPKNYHKFMRKVDEVMLDDGIFLLHTIGGINTGGTDPWIDRYIFPGGVIPTMGQLTNAADGTFVIEDVHNFGPYYEKTLLAWHRNFKKAWPALSEKYGERFYKMWEFYLLSCAAGFKVRDMQLWQFVMTKPGQHNVYHAPR